MKIHPSTIPYYNIYWYVQESPDMDIDESFYNAAFIFGSQLAIDYSLWQAYGLRPLTSYLTDTVLIHAISNPLATAVVLGTAYSTITYSKILKDPTHPHTVGRLQEAKAGYPTLGGVGFY